MTVLRRLFGTDKNGVERALITDTSGRLKQSHGQPDPILGQLDAAGETVILPFAGFSSFSVFLRGTFTGTILLEQSPDSTDGADGNWFPLQATNGGAVGAAVSTLLSAAALATISFNGAAPGAEFIRVRCTVRTSGLAEVQLVASTASVTPTLPIHPVTQSGTFTVTSTPSTPTTFNQVSAASTNGALIVAGAQRVTEVSCFNPTGATVFLKLYNKATAPTAGTDVPVVTIPVAAGALANIEFGPLGKAFSLGVGISVTGAAPASDTTAVAVGVQSSVTRA